MKHAIGLIFGLLASHLTLPVYAGGQPDGVSRCFQRLADQRAYALPDTAVIESLISHGTESLSFFYANFDGIDRKVAYWFRTRVLPKLPPADTSDIVLSEFRRDALVLDEVLQLTERAVPIMDHPIIAQLFDAFGQGRGETLKIMAAYAKIEGQLGRQPSAFEHGEKEGESLAILAAYTSIEGRFRRLRWTTEALGTLKNLNGYDAMYPVFLQYSCMQFEFIHTLYEIDPVRAIEGFTSLARSSDDALRFKGISAFREVEQTPPCSLIARLIDDPVEQIRSGAIHFVSRLDIDCLGLLIDSTNPMAVRYSVGAISRLISKQHKGGWGQVLEITDAYLAAVKLMLGSAFHDERLRDNDERFPDHVLLAKKEGAVLEVGNIAHLLYETEDRTLREMSTKDPDDANHIQQAKPRMYYKFAYGSVSWRVCADYMTMILRIDSGGYSYFFRRKDGRWSPVCGSPLPRFVE